MAFQQSFTDSQIYRVPLTDGNSIVGRHIPAHKLDTTLKALGAMQQMHEGEGHSPATVYEHVLRSGHVATLANGWKLKRAMVGGEKRLELEVPIGMHRRALTEDGVYTEKIAHKDRFFVPVDPEGAAVIEKVIKSRNAPITEVKSPQPE